MPFFIKNLVLVIANILKPCYYYFHRETYMIDLYSIKETSSMLKVSSMTIRRLIKKRAIPHHRIGTKYFFTENDIQLYLTGTFEPMGVKKDENTR